MDADDGMAAGAEVLALRVDAKDAPPSLGRNAGAALADVHDRVRPGLAAVGGAGQDVLRAGAAADGGVNVLLVADIDGAVVGHARLARLLVAVRRAWPA